MGEISEMRLDGTLCAGCGEFLDEIIEGKEPAGYPVYCAGCGGESEEEEGQK